MNIDRFVIIKQTKTKGIPKSAPDVEQIAPSNLFYDMFSGESRDSKIENMQEKQNRIIRITFMVATGDDHGVVREIIEFAKYSTRGGFYFEWQIALKPATS